MNINAAIVSHLKADPELSALLGDDGDVYQVLVSDPNAPFPRITVFQTPGGEHVHHMGGISGKAQAVFQIDVWTDDDVEQSQRIAERVRLTLDMFQPNTIGTYPNSIDISGMTLTMPSDHFEDNGKGNEAFIMSSRIDVTVWYTETTS